MAERGSRERLLLERLDEIGRAVSATGQGLALIGVGSVGLERERLDQYSDLDFFVIVRDGCKAGMIRDLGWLAAAHPVVYSFRNTVDGCKALFEDGIYCEFAVFEVADLETVPFAEGEVVWKAPEFDANLARPRVGPPATEDRTTEWLLGEAITNLYVGLGRYRRGEKLSAFRFVQVFVVDRLVELAASLGAEAPGYRDGFAPERRFEARYPGIANELPRFMQGYDRTPECALAILGFLEAHFEVNRAMKEAILGLCRDDFPSVDP